MNSYIPERVNPNPNLLFLTLRTFSATGGIEKVSRLAGKALVQQGEEEAVSVTVFSVYDRSEEIDEKYFPARAFKGFGGSRSRFVWQSIRQGVKASVVLLSHINLLPVGYAIKKISPAVKLVLLVHGIEVWSRLPGSRRQMLKSCDRVLPVSRFTAGKMMAIQGLEKEKLRVVNNCIDPFLCASPDQEKKNSLLKRYGLTENNKILLTLTRLSEKERPKGYDQVLRALKALKDAMPELRYLLLGKYTASEKDRLDRLVAELGLGKEVMIPGFVPDDELPEHFSLADIYIMPSRKEGFGIVFIEALFYGKPVIAGNCDGSVDALAGGRFGALVDPGDEDGIRKTLLRFLQDDKSGIPEPAEVMKHFGYSVYRQSLWQAMRPFFAGSLQPH